MTEIQAKYDALGALLVKTPKNKRNDVIRKWCKENQMPYMSSKGELVKPGTTAFEGCVHPLLKRKYLSRDPQGRNIVYCHECEETYTEEVP